MDQITKIRTQFLVLRIYNIKSKNIYKRTIGLEEEFILDESLFRLNL